MLQLDLGQDGDLTFTIYGTNTCSSCSCDVRAGNTDTGSGGRVDLSKTARRLPGVQIDENSGEYGGLDFAAWG